MKKDAGYHILRVSMGVTFLWIGILIFREPLFWAGFLPAYFLDLLPTAPENFMLIVGALDIVLGFLMLIDRFMRPVSAIAALHMLGILLTSGIDSITVRDIGLLGASVAMFWANLEEKERKRVMDSTIKTRKA